MIEAHVAYLKCDKMSLSVMSQRKIYIQYL